MHANEKVMSLYICHLRTAARYFTRSFAAGYEDLSSNFCFHDGMITSIGNLV